MTAPQPTDFELEILQELWAKGPQTVRQVHDVLSKRRQLVYTTVLKAMQVMHEKGLLKRDDSERAHVYVPAVDEQKVKRSIVMGVIDQVFGGSAAGLAMHALNARPTSSDELAQIQSLLGELEDGQKTAAKEKPRKGAGK